MMTNVSTAETVRLMAAERTMIITYVLVKRKEYPYLTYIMERLLFFIYNIIRSDQRYKEDDSRHVKVTIFLLSFFEIIVLLPLALILNNYFSVIKIGSFLGLPKVLRYLLIFSILALLFLINFYFLGKDQRIEHIAKRMEHQREAYLKYKFLLIVLPVSLAGVLLVIARILK